MTFEDTNIINILDSPSSSLSSSAPSSQSSQLATESWASSWAELVDESTVINYKLLNSSSCMSLEDSSSDKKINTSASSYNIADIVSKNPETANDITLLEWQTYISLHLKKYIKQCDNNAKFDYNLHIAKFEWLAKSSKVLSDKMRLSTTLHKINNFDVLNGVIPRSSYKFCEYNYDCQFNYKKKINGCYAHHFVHNLVFADINAIIYYLKNIHDSNNEYNYNELNKCMNTICYVIKHMYEELSNLIYHYGDYYDKVRNDKARKNCDMNKKSKQNTKKIFTKVSLGTNS